MIRWLVLAALFFSFSARADMFPNGANANLPTTGTPTGTVCTTASGALIKNCIPVVPGTLTVGTSGNDGTIKAPVEVLHESQGGRLILDAHVLKLGDYDWLLSADPMLLTWGTVLSSPVTVTEAPAVRFTLAGVDYDSPYTIKPGDTDNLIALGICQAVKDNTALTAAMNATKDQQAHGMYGAFQTACANQVNGATMVFDQPYIAGTTVTCPGTDSGGPGHGLGTVGGTTACALNSAHTTISLFGGAIGSGMPRFDGGPRPIVTRWYPAGVSFANGDLGPDFQFQTRIGAAGYSQLAVLYNQFIAPDTNSLRIANRSAGAVKDKISIGGGVAFNTVNQNANQCGDPGNGKVRLCGTTSGAVDQTTVAAAGSNLATWPANTGTVLTSGAAQFQSIAVTNPTGTTSTTAVMMGAGSTCTITPNSTGRVRFSLQGTMANNTIHDGVSVALLYGSGAAPANGAASTGIGGSRTVTLSDVPVAATLWPFFVAFDATGLAAGTPYWFDPRVAAVTAGTASVSNLQCEAHEF